MNYETDAILKKSKKRRSKVKNKHSKKYNSNKLKTNKRKSRTRRRSRKNKKIYLSGGSGDWKSYLASLMPSLGKTQNRAPTPAPVRVAAETTPAPAPLPATERSESPEEYFERKRSEGVNIFVEKTGYDVKAARAILERVGWDIGAAFEEYYNQQSTPSGTSPDQEETGPTGPTGPSEPEQVPVLIFPEPEPEPELRHLKKSPEIQAEDTEGRVFNYCSRSDKVPNPSPTRRSYHGRAIDHLANKTIGDTADIGPTREGSYIAKFDNWYLWPQWEGESEENYLIRKNNWITIINYLRYEQSWKIFEIITMNRGGDGSHHSDVAQAGNIEGDDDYFRLAFASKHLIDKLIEEYEYIKVNLGDTKKTIEIKDEPKVIPSVNGILDMGMCTGFLLSDPEARDIGQVISDGLLTIRDDEPRLIERRIDWVIKQKDIDRELRQLTENREDLKSKGQFLEAKQLHSKIMEKNDEKYNYSRWTPESALLKNMGEPGMRLADKYNDSIVVRGSRQLVQLEGRDMPVDELIKRDAIMLTYEEFINLFSGYNFDPMRMIDTWGGRHFQGKKYNRAAEPEPTPKDYENLGIDKTKLESLPRDQIMRILTKAFRKKALEYHPDKIPKNVTPKRAAELLALYHTVNESFDKLKKHYER